MRQPPPLPEAAPPQALLDKVRAAPKEPGCYLFKNENSHVIYVGKGKNIWSRVRQYFQKGHREDKVLRLVRSARDVEFFTTAGELDALLHEHRLIKEFRPWFNTQLKRDRAHPFIRVATGEPYPTLSVSAEKAGDGARYFGCFHDEDDAMEALSILNRIWKTPACGRTARTTGRACLNYHLDNCLGPCEAKPDPNLYARAVGEAVRFLSGKGSAAPAKIRREMRAHAVAMDYEKAARCKAALDDLERLGRKCRRMFHLPRDQDVLLFIRPYRSVGFALFLLRKGMFRRQDFAAHLEPPALEQFLAAPEEEAPPWLIPALSEIYVDKLFIPLPTRWEASSLERRIRRGYAEFIGQRTYSKSKKQTGVSG